MSKLSKFKSFLIISILVLIAVTATPASVTYFTDAFRLVENVELVERNAADDDGVKQAAVRLNDGE